MLSSVLLAVWTQPKSLCTIDCIRPPYIRKPLEIGHELVYQQHRRTVALAFSASTFALDGAMDAIDARRLHRGCTWKHTTLHRTLERALGFPNETLSKPILMSFT